MNFIIDRFEGDYAVVELENKEMIDIPRTILPVGAKEGDIINISIQETETEKQKKRIQDKFNSLFSE